MSDSAEQHLQQLLRGQDKLESAIAALQHSVDALPKLLHASPNRAQSHPRKDQDQGDEVSFRPSSSMDLHEPPSLHCLKNNGRAGSSTLVAEAGSLISTISSFASPSLISLEPHDHFAQPLVPSPHHQDFMSPSARKHVPVLHHLFLECARSLRRSPEAMLSSSSMLADEEVSPGHATSLVPPPSAWARKAERRIPFHPTSAVPTFFDIASLIVLLVDAALVPVAIAWDLEPTGTLGVVALCMVSFWICDMIAKFCTGYIDGSAVVQKWNAIAWNYMKRGFALDGSLIVLDAVDLLYTHISQASGAGAGPLKAVRLLRFTKITRMLRIIARLGDGSTGARIDAIKSTLLRRYGAFSKVAQCITLAGILIKVMFAILGLCHFLTCLFVLLTRNLASQSEGWLSLSPRDFSDFEEYLMGFYWTLTTMFSGASYLPPMLVWEMCFSISMVLFGALFVTSLTSSMAATLIEWQQRFVEMKRRSRNLQGFLEQQGVSGIVIMAVREDFHHNTATSRERVTETDVNQELTCLSLGVRHMLRNLQYAEDFQKIQVIRLVHVLRPSSLQELCGSASFEVLRSGEVLFSSHTSMEQTTFLARGHAHYNMIGGVRETMALPGPSVHSLPIGDGTWICEVALLLSWKTMGRVEAEATCETLSISVELFTRTVSKSPAAMALASLYGEVLCQAIVEYGSETTDLDLGIDGDVLVTNIPSPIKHELVSAPALECLKQQRTTWAAFISGNKAMSDLEQEIRSGKCHLAAAENGEIARVVKMVVLHMEDANGRVLVQLAEGSRGSTNTTDLRVKFGLPGHKVEGDRSPADIIKRMIENSFRDMASRIEVLGPEPNLVFEQEDSPSYGITTRYIKIVFKAVLHGSMDIDAALPIAQTMTITRFDTVSSMAMGQAVFTTIASDRRRSLFKWFDPKDFQRRWQTREKETSALKAWLSSLPSGWIDAAAKWRFKGGEDRSLMINSEEEQEEQEQEEEPAPLGGSSSRSLDAVRPAQEPATPPPWLEQQSRNGHVPKIETGASSRLITIAESDDEPTGPCWKVMTLEEL